MGRLARQVTVLIATMALASACSVIESFDPSMASTQPGGRIELPEVGIALAFPDEWLIEERPATATEMFSSIDEPGLRRLLMPVVAAMPPSMHDRCIVADLAPLVEAQPGWSTLDDVVAGYRGFVEADARWVDLESSVVDLSAGPSGHIWRNRSGESESVSSYVFTQADAWFLLECVTHSDPSEDWHSVAETFEFLAPVPVSPRPFAGWDVEPADLPRLFPTAPEVGEVMGLEVEAMGIQTDMSQLWESIDIAPGALVAKRLQGYRALDTRTAGPADDGFAGMFIDIDLFRSPQDASTYGRQIAAILLDTMITAFPTRLSADLVAAGSWTSDEGFGGSTIVVQDGPLVIIVTAAQSGATQLRAATEAIAALIVSNYRGEPALAVPGS